ncbi:hypothetical protein D9757_012494 [Collybiopsis confluens]|uniref:Uncharacterized protein n=1 Tax=Collybiopsis confluens TaxID=2823264 RepID=A0A8H5GGT6_9AGAR|nr:hypothetical protein D9757_012494 [Collybiopsis confluens]
MKISDQAVAHLAALGSIFVISLIAVAFPAASKKVRFLSIPKIVFFIGKHFGTGVILATAFGHLLQDSFESLTSKTVRNNFPGVGERTGFIILGSLLAIFLVEYISTSYVDYLHESSPPIEIDDEEEPVSLRVSHLSESRLEPVDESTPLLTNSVLSRLSQYSQHSQAPSTISRARRPQSHYLSSIVNNNPRHSRSNENFYIANDVSHHLNNGEYELVGGPDPGSGTIRRSRIFQPSEGHDDTAAAVAAVAAASSTSTAHDLESQRQLVSSRNRQIVGILVLQFGIMIHSFVIGLTLSLTSGPGFGECFVVPAACLSHSYSTFANSSSSKASLVTAIIFHQLFEGLSLGIRISAIPPPIDKLTSEEAPSSTHHSLFQPILAFLFAVTTPFGIGLGMLLFGSQAQDTSHRILLTQGLMSAVSAGMLIYAATVEMMAADFVFGNLGLGGGDSHGHSHGNEFIEGVDSDEDGHDHRGEETETEGGVSVKRRLQAVGSLLAGVVAMGLIALAE